MSLFPRDAFSLPVNLYSIIYALGAMVALWFFVPSVSESALRGALW